jgi:hypothetical protein
MPDTSHFNLDLMLAGYIEAAIWSSTDDDGNPLDARFDKSDLAPETVEKMKADVVAFATTQAEHLRPEFLLHALMGYAWEEYVGHDFWFTRNGHGAGFWDGDWEKSVGVVLSDAARAYGECDLYVGDDDKLYLI